MKQLKCRIGIEIEADVSHLPKISEEIQMLSPEVMRIGDTEYYSDISEYTYNVKSLKYLKNAIEDISQFPDALKYGTTKGGNFVGTHVHFFDKELYKAIKAMHNTYLLDMMIYILLSEYVKDMHKTELHRFVYGYHFLSHIEKNICELTDILLRNEDRDADEDIDEDEERRKKFFPYFALNKDRYRIANPSPATRKGKKRSIEIRCLWNSILEKEYFNAVLKEIYNLVYKFANNSELVDETSVRKEFRNTYIANLKKLNQL